YFSNVGTDTFVGGSGADNFFGAGGSDIITLNSTSSTGWIGFYDVSQTASSSVNGTLLPQAITDIGGGAEIFIDGEGTTPTTINGFTLGASGNVMNFNTADWAVGNGALSAGGTDYGLRANTGGLITNGTNATLGLVNSAGATPPAAEVTLDNISTYANAAQ